MHVWCLASVGSAAQAVFGFEQSPAGIRRSRFGSILAVVLVVESTELFDMHHLVQLNKHRTHLCCHFGLVNSH